METKWKQNMEKRISYRTKCNTSRSEFLGNRQPEMLSKRGLCNNSSTSRQEADNPNLRYIILYKLVLHSACKCEYRLANYILNLRHQRIWNLEMANVTVEIHFTTNNSHETTWRLGLSLLSTSSLMSVGLCRPALANSTRPFGSVAEKRTVWRLSPSRWITSRSWASNPISKRRSASSNTTYSTEDSFRSISTTTCINRPGVAIIL